MTRRLGVLEIASQILGEADRGHQAAGVATGRRSNESIEVEPTPNRAQYMSISTASRRLLDEGDEAGSRTCS